MKKISLLLVGLLMFGSVSSVAAEVPALHMDEKKDTGNNTSDLFQVVENEYFSFEAPSGWIPVYENLSITVNKNADSDFPYIMVVPVAIDGTIEDQLASWTDLYADTFQNQLVGEQDRVRYAVPSTDRVVEGIKTVFSSADGMDTYTQYSAIEDVDGVYYSYFCLYLSGSYDENHHEDETTYFEYLNAIDTLKTK